MNIYPKLAIFDNGYTYVAAIIYSERDGLVIKTKGKILPYLKKGQSFFDISIGSHAPEWMIISLSTVLDIGI